MKRFCYLAVYGIMEGGEPMSICVGKLRQCHLIPRQSLKRLGHDPADPRSWVWGCGGYGYGNTGHHGSFDSLGVRALRLPRSAIPEGTEQLARELGIEWWLARRYGERTI